MASAESMPARSTASFLSAGYGCYQSKNAQNSSPIFKKYAILFLMLSRRDLYLDQPAEVAIETLALCNAACTFCPYPTIERQGAKLPDATIRDLIQQMSRFAVPFVFSPFKLNEPFLDPRLQGICEEFLVCCPQGSLRLFTNGSALTNSNIAWVAKLSRVQHLWVSLNSIDEKEHQTLMQFKTPLFKRIAVNLDLLHKVKLLDGFPHDVVLSRVAVDNAQDLEFLKTCQQRWPRFRAMLIKKDAWLQDIEAPQIPIPKTPCSRWFEMSIMATGIASLCCMDSENKYPLGDVNRQSLLEIYNAPAWRERRERMLPRTEVPVCQTCSY